MADYTVLTRKNISSKAHGVKVARIDVLLDVTTKEDAERILKQAAKELIGMNDALEIFAYLEPIALKWQGWIARVEYRANEVPVVLFDNDPILREALYYDAQNRNTSRN